MVLRMVRLGMMLGLLLSFESMAKAQTVQPVIAEYTGKAQGSFVVSNSSLTEMAVVLEPKSFSIDADGNGIFRPLDSGIHLQLSTSSLRLGPHESQTIFYKVQADNAPAWLTVYATFAPLHAGPGMTVHVMLPHTIYLYSKQTLARDAVQMVRSEYDAETRQLVCELRNAGTAAGRAESVEASAGRLHVADAGFPLLPGGTRRIVMHWTEPGSPSLVTVSFDRFTLKMPVTAKSLDRP